MKARLYLKVSILTSRYNDFTVEHVQVIEERYIDKRREYIDDMYMTEIYWSADLNV